MKSTNILRQSLNSEIKLVPRKVYDNSVTAVKSTVNPVKRSVTVIKTREYSP